MTSRIGLLLSAACLLAACLPGAPARAATPNDTRYADQWWLGAYSATTAAGVPDLPTAWDRSTGSPASGAAPVIAVLDSGIVNHPDLDAHLVLPGYDFVSSIDYANDGNGRDNDPTDPGDLLTAAEKAANVALWDGCPASTANSWHGTMIAGQVGALTNNAAGVAAATWNGRVLPVRVSGKCGAAASDVIDAMRWAAGFTVAGVPVNANPARILVLGVAGVGSCNVNDADANVAATARAYVAAIAELRAAGVMIVAPAGNERSAVGRPANCAGVFGVASLNRLGMKALYSNYGSEVALATVGGDDDQGRTCDKLLADSGILSVSNRPAGSASNDYSLAYASASGTSFAVPIVAATASLMLAVNPSLTLAQIETGLKASARPHVAVPALGTCSALTNFSRCACTTGTCGAGILDAPQALAYAAAPASYVAPTRGAVSLSGSAIDQCAAAMGLPTTTPTTPVTPTTPTTPATPVASTSGGGGGGGGAMDLRWMALLGLAIVGVLRSQRRTGAEVSA